MQACLDWRILVNPGLWTAFDRAKQTLLVAIRNSLASERHILLLDPAVRNPSGGLRNETIGDLNTFTTRLQETMNDLNDVSKEINLYRSHVQASLSPIALLPPELMRDIAKLAVGGPENTRTIMNLSHVSTAWREVVTGTSEFFTASDWNKWHVQLVTIWVNRAQKQPHKIFLDDTITEALFRYNTAHAADVPGAADHIGELWENLERALLNCIHLHIVADLPPPPVGFDSWFQSWGLEPFF